MATEVSGRAKAALPLEQHLTWRLHRVNKLTDKVSAEAYEQAFGLPVGEARCLAAIGNFAPLSVNDLAARANLNKGQASRAAQALVDRGLVRKLASEVDGRGVVLSPTAAGHKRWAGVMALIARRNEEIFGCLSAAERRQLGDMLDRLMAHAGATVQDP
ncbi:MAG: winged helix-turn-helix transcriptional regulator [Ramlibacter sp.]|nr:winged helix-turn-helix transcriptional regulator [Ramlibacter sp.]